jgi:hypothetical protein
MNDYSHALVKEISAQLLGYNPSPMWGKLVDKQKLDKPEEFRSIMLSHEPKHVRPNDAFTKVSNIAKTYINKIPSNSHVNRNGFTGL